jgi:hypothetical protein
MTRRVLVAELDVEELAVRLVEAAIGQTRPVGMTPAQALAATDLALPGEARIFRLQANAAMEYFREQIEKAQLEQ